MSDRPPEKSELADQECGVDATDATARLDATGGWDGPLTLWTYREDAATTTVLNALANQLRTNLGIEDIEENATTVAEIYPALEEQEVDGGPFLLYAGATYPHLYAMASVMFTADGWANVTNYDGKEATELLAEAAAGENTLTDLTQQATETALADVPIAPIYYPAGGLVWADNLEGVVPEFLGGPHLAGISAE